MSGKSNADFIFDKYAKDGVRMSLAEFSIMVKTFLKSVSSPEVLQMYKHFDRGGKSYITRQDFTAAFSSDVKDQTFTI
jgi:Ca2+-binding EF-hand superfamily protein